MWKNPREEKPEVGQKVWVLTEHWKKQVPGSYEVYGVEVWQDNKGSSYCINNDDNGCGASMFFFPGDPSANSLGDEVVAWAHLKDIPLPSWLI